MLGRGFWTETVSAGSGVSEKKRGRKYFNDVSDFCISQPILSVELPVYNETEIWGRIIAFPQAGI